MLSRDHWKCCKCFQDVALLACLLCVVSAAVVAAVVVVVLVHLGFFAPGLTANAPLVPSHFR